MAERVRQVIKIDEELCNGCGLCVPSCAEGALQIIDGKAKMVADKYCDGLGACLGECPQGAISFETREADEYDEEATLERLMQLGRSADAHHEHMAEHGMGQAAKAHDHSAHKHSGFVCPSARTIDRTHEAVDTETAAPGTVKSELRQWPVKLYLVNPQAPYFENADLLIAADCVPFAYGSIHPDFMKGKTIVTGCPKFDDTEQYFDKLTDIIRLNNIRSITVLVMEVPCCSGMLRLAQVAAAASEKNIPMEAVTISLNGEVKGRAPVAA